MLHTMPNADKAGGKAPQVLLADADTSVQCAFTPDQAHERRLVRAVTLETEPAPGEQVKGDEEPGL